jgi:alcohol dehydrogenase class IV
VALLLPAVMDFNITAAPARHAQVAIAMGAAHGNSDLETARMGIALIRNLISDCRLPLSLDELKIPYKSIPKMAEDAMKVQRLLKNNVRTVTQKDAENIYRASFRLI